MNKSCILFVTTVLINHALGQDFIRPNAQFLFPGQDQLNRQGQIPGQGQIPRQGQGSGQFLFPGQNQLPRQSQFPREGQLSGQGQSSGPGQLPAQGTENASTTQSPAVTDCIRNCPVTSEYNPVCGTHNVTYNNPGRLYCAQFCGVNVNLLRRSRCPTPAQ